jgi:hypothetical protein
VGSGCGGMLVYLGDSPAPAGGWYAHKQAWGKQCACMSACSKTGSSLAALCAGPRTHPSSLLLAPALPVSTPPPPPLTWPAP